jgi:acyl-CoA thioester hydrolase
MQPAAFVPEPQSDDRFVRDRTSGHVYHRTRHRVLYADTDRSGVVYHANYFRYFEQGRASVMRDLGYPYAEVEASGYVYPIVELGLRYFHPLVYDDEMWIHTRPTDLERVRVKFEYVITHATGGERICTGFTQHCAANERGVPVAVDPVTINAWKTFPR